MMSFFLARMGVFMKVTSLQIILLRFSVKIIRHTSPDYQTLLVSSLR